MKTIQSLLSRQDRLNLHFRRIIRQLKILWIEINIFRNLMLYVDELYCMDR